MAQVSKHHQDQLARIKSNINESYVYFRKNRDYFNKMRNFVFNTTISDDQRAALQELDRPELEFNVVEAFISRLLGEFSKQLPGVSVHSQPTESIPPESTINAVEGHMRYILNGLNANEIYKDQLSGGFSVMKVWTEYEHPKSFKQKICLDRGYDPLLVGFDPAATKAHKGDGSYCFEIIPMTEQQFRAIYGNSIDITGCFQGYMEGFKWGYKSNGKKIIMLCNYYEKRTKKVMLYELPGGITVTKAEYQEMLMLYEINGDIAQPPIPVNKRWTHIPQIDRYQIISTEVLEHIDTDFCALPLIFVDGNSITVRRDGDGGNIEQITRSYIHNAQGAQKLKNLAGQTIANHIENLVEHKMKVANESIPVQYEEAYTNVQSASNYIYNQYSDDGTKEFNAPQEVQKMPLPPEIMNAYMGAETTIQSSLGSYDAQLGINKNQLSGVAIVEGATQSNAAAMPFIVNYLAALQQAAEIILDLIPKYYVTPRSIPVLTNEDKKEHISINGDGTTPRMNFNSADLRVQVNAGVNFEVQQNRSLQTLIQLSQALPGMAQIINNPKGLAILADNLTIKGADQIKSLAEQAIKAAEKIGAQPPPPNPALMKVGLEQQKINNKAQTDAALLAIREKEAETDLLNVIGGMKETKIKYALQAERDDTERMVHGINAHIAHQNAITDAKTAAVNNAATLVKTAHAVKKENPDLIGINPSPISTEAPQAPLIPDQTQ